MPTGKMNTKNDVRLEYYPEVGYLNISSRELSDCLLVFTMIALLVKRDNLTLRSTLALFDEDMNDLDIPVPKEATYSISNLAGDEEFVFDFDPVENSDYKIEGEHKVVYNIL